MCTLVSRTSRDAFQQQQRRRLIFFFLALLIAHQLLDESMQHHLSCLGVHQKPLQHALDFVVFTSRLLPFMRRSSVRLLKIRKTRVQRVLQRVHIKVCDPVVSGRAHCCSCWHEVGGELLSIWWRALVRSPRDGRRTPMRADVFPRPTSLHGVRRESEAQDAVHLHTQDAVARLSWRHDPSKMRNGGASIQKRQLQHSKSCRLKGEEANGILLSTMKATLNLQQIGKQHVLGLTEHMQRAQESNAN